MAASSTVNPSASPSDPNGPTGKLATWIHDTKVVDIPSEVIERAKYLILDGIACAFVAAHLPWSETAAKAIFKIDPPGQCTVIGWGGRKLPPLSAALLNSAFVQGFELDDWHSGAPLHTNSLLLPALFAATEAADVEQKHSGLDFLKAYVVGCEVGPRVGLGVHGADLLSRGWHSGAVQGPSASAAAVSSYLGLNPAQIEWALGTACTQAGGLMSAQYGSDAKRMQHGFAARNGLLATLLAREDYTGIEEVYERPYGGFLSMFSQGTSKTPQYLPDEITSGLGSRWELNNIRVKLHAAMAALHGTIDAIENLQKQHPHLFENSNLPNITRIVTKHGKAAYEHGGWRQPSDKPLSTVAAQMSIQNAAASQLLDREVLMSQFGAAKLNRPEVRELMEKVHPEHDSSIDQLEGIAKFATRIEVFFADGTSVKEYVAAAKGIDPPASNEQIVEKWRGLVKGILDDERREHIEKAVLSLDKVQDMRELIGLLAGEVKCPIDV